MANGIITLASTRAVLEGRIVWESVSNGSTANSSYVAGHLQVRRNDGYSTKGTWTGAMRIGATVQEFSKASTSVGSDWVTMLEFAINQGHNDDGTGSVFFEAYCNGPTGTSMAGYGVSGNATITLDTIPRASTPSISGTLQLGNAVTINTNRASSSFTHNIRYLFGNKSETIGTGVTDNVSWTIPKDLANEIPNSTSGTGTISCDTYNGSTLIGSKYISFTASIPDTVEFKPTISEIVLSENSSSDVPSSWGFYVQNKSKLNYQVSADGTYSSNIKSYNVVVNGATYNKVSDTTDELKLSGTNTIVATVTDSRGRTATLTKEFTVVAYEGPKITKFEAHRCNSDGTLNEEGEYVKIEIEAKVPKLNSKNSYSYVFQYKDTDYTQYTDYDIELTETTVEEDFVLSGSFVMTADGNNAFDYKLVITDAFFSINAFTDIGTAFQLFNWNASGKGFALGKVSEKDGFEMGMDAYYKGIELIDLFYPIGSIYTTVSDVNPNEHFIGTTWELWGAGKVPVGVDATQEEFNTVEKIGGSKTVTLTKEQMPGHNHSVSVSGTRLDSSGSTMMDAVVNVQAGSGDFWNIGMRRGDGTSGHSLHITNTGNGQAHSNIQPYITCYMWKRTA